MFDYELRAHVKVFKISEDNENDEGRRLLTMTIQRYFDEQVADGLGEPGRVALDGLRTHSFRKVDIALDNVYAKATLKGVGPEITLLDCKGVKASATATKDTEGEEADATDPDITLEIQFPFTKEAWMFFGDNALRYVDFWFTRMQPPLPKTEDPPKTKKNNTQLSLVGAPEETGKTPKPARSEERQSREDGDREEEQDAAETPEEAEVLRAERLERDRRVTVLDTEGKVMEPEGNGADDSILTQPEIERCEECKGPAAGPHAVWCSQGTTAPAPTERQPRDAF